MNGAPRLDAFLAIVAIATAIQLFLTVRHEYDRNADSPRHWSRPAFDRLRRHLGPRDEVIFLTDDLETANVRIHSCRFAIIPTPVEVLHSWDEVYPRFEAGAWCVFDARSSESIDAAERKLADWAGATDRRFVFHRMDERLALFRTGDG